LLDWDFDLMEQGTGSVSEVLIIVLDALSVEKAA